MPRRVEVVLGEEERKVLERWARHPKSSQALALRCRIVLATADGESSKEIAGRLGCHPSTVGRWRGRFAQRGLDGLHDEPRPGKAHSISDEDVERVIVKTLEEQVLWIERFGTFEELRAAVRRFAVTYNRERLLERHGYRTPIEARAHLATLPQPVVA